MSNLMMQTWRDIGSVSVPVSVQTRKMAIETVIVIDVNMMVVVETTTQAMTSQMTRPSNINVERVTIEVVVNVIETAVKGNVHPAVNAQMPKAQTAKLIPTVTVTATAMTKNQRPGPAHVESEMEVHPVTRRSTYLKDSIHKAGRNKAIVRVDKRRNKIL